MSPTDRRARPSVSGTRRWTLRCAVYLLIATSPGCLGGASADLDGGGIPPSGLQSGSWTGSFQPEGGGPTLSMLMTATPEAVGSRTIVTLGDSQLGAGIAVVSGRSVTITLSLGPACAGSAAFVAKLESRDRLVGTLVSSGCAQEVRGTATLRWQGGTS